MGEERVKRTAGRIAGTALLAAALTGIAGPAGAGTTHLASAGVISTVAGGVGGPGRATTVALQACGVAVHGGALYVADVAAVRKIDSAGQLTTPAGTGVYEGPTNNGGLATSADLATCGVAVDHTGNLVIADPTHRQIRVVATKTGTFYGQAMTAGHIYGVAGNGNFGYGASGVPARMAPLAYVQDVAVDGHGNLVIADSGSGAQTSAWARIQVVAASTGTFYGVRMTAGDIYVVAGGGTLIGPAANGHPATQAAIGKYVGHVTVDRAGNLLVAGSKASRIWLAAATSGRFYGQAMTAGDIYTIAGTGGVGFSGDSGPATKARVATPDGVAVDAAGNAVIADTGNHRIRVVAARTGTFYDRAMTTGDIYTIAGTGTAGFSGEGGPATGAELNLPEGVAVDPATGNVVVADFRNGAVRVVAGSAGTFFGQAMTAGHIYTVGGIPSDGTELFSGDGGPATRAELDSPVGLAADQAGNTVIADDVNSRIRVVAAVAGTFYGRAMTAGDIYTVAGDGTLGFSGDGGPATGAALSNPEDVTVDGAGNLVISDSGNERIRVVAAATGTFYGQAMTAAHIYTVAGDGSFQFSGDGGPATSAGMAPSGVAVDSSGNLALSDFVNDRVRMVAARTGTFYGQAMTAGDIYTVAGDGNYGFSGDGGPGTSAELAFPDGVAVDGTGNLLIADSSNSRIRVVAARTGTFYGQAMTAGDIYTVAGDGNYGFSGDGGPATAAALSLPPDVTVDGAGNLVIADSSNYRIRVVAAHTGTFYGKAMTAGDIYTVAGDGTPGFTGDGGPATSAELTGPEGLTVNSNGDLLMSDSNLIRMVTG